MKTIIHLFTHNLGLKLLALVLALIDYYSMRESIRSPSGAYAPVFPKGTLNVGTTEAGN